MKQFQILVKDDFFLPEELELIWHELHVLAQPEVLRDPTETGSAKDDGVVLKKNKGIFFGDVYADMNCSPLFRASRKLFEGYTGEFAELGFVNKSVFSTKKSGYLLSYYGDGDSYECHKDTAVTTVLYWFCKEPKAFSGGDIYFPEIDQTVEFKNNRMIMFPSWADHEVSQVHLDSDGDLMGRFCVTHFLFL